MLPVKLVITAVQFQEEYERLSKKLEEEKAAMTNIANQFKEEKEMTAQ